MDVDIWFHRSDTHEFVPDIHAVECGGFAIRTSSGTVHFMGDENARRFHEAVVEGMRLREIQLLIEDSNGNI